MSLSIQRKSALLVLALIVLLLLVSTILYLGFHPQTIHHFLQIVPDAVDRHD